MSKNIKHKKSNGAKGLLMLLVVLSIAYSSYVVAYGTTGWAPKIMLVPQILFGSVVLGYVFWRSASK